MSTPSRKRSFNLVTSEQFFSSSSSSSSDTRLDAARIQKLASSVKGLNIPNEIVSCVTDQERNILRRELAAYIKEVAEDLDAHQIPVTAGGLGQFNDDWAFFFNYVLKNHPDVGNGLARTTTMVDGMKITNWETKPLLTAFELVRLKHDELIFCDRLLRHFVDDAHTQIIDAFAGEKIEMDVNIVKKQDRTLQLTYVMKHNIIVSQEFEICGAEAHPGLISCNEHGPLKEVDKFCIHALHVVRCYSKNRDSALTALIAMKNAACDLSRLPSIRMQLHSLLLNPQAVSINVELSNKSETASSSSSSSSLSSSPVTSSPSSTVSVEILEILSDDACPICQEMAPLSSSPFACVDHAEFVLRCSCCKTWVHQSCTLKWAEAQQADLSCSLCRRKNEFRMVKVSQIGATWSKILARCTPFTQETVRSMCKFCVISAGFESIDFDDADEVDEALARVPSSLAIRFIRQFLFELVESETTKLVESETTKLEHNAANVLKTFVDTQIRAELQNGFLESCSDSDNISLRAFLGELLQCIPSPEFVRSAGIDTEYEAPNKWIERKYSQMRGSAKLIYFKYWDTSCDASDQLPLTNELNKLLYPSDIKPPMHVYYHATPYASSGEVMLSPLAVSYFGDFDVRGAFYVTKNFQQAKDWCVKKALRYFRSNDSICKDVSALQWCVICFVLPKALEQYDEYKGHAFESQDHSWRSLVVRSRLELKIEYDRHKIFDGAPLHWISGDYCTNPQIFNKGNKVYEMSESQLTALMTTLEQTLQGSPDQIALLSADVLRRFAADREGKATGHIWVPKPSWIVQQIQKLIQNDRRFTQKHLQTLSNLCVSAKKKEDTRLSSANQMASLTQIASSSSSESMSSFTSSNSSKDEQKEDSDRMHD